MNELATRRAARLVGSTALSFSAVCLLSDVIEPVRGGFSDGQPWLTLAAEAAVPVMVLAALCVGYAVIRTTSLPWWTGIAPIAVVLVSLAQNQPEGLQPAAAGIRDLGFAGMGAALLRRTVRPRANLVGAPVSDPTGSNT